MKASFGRRSSRGPVRVSNRASSLRTGAADNGTSGGTNIQRPRSNIPKLRSSSFDRESRSVLRSNEMSTTKKRRSRSQATPHTPAMQRWEGVNGLASAQSARSRSGSRCGSADRALGFYSYKGKVTDSRLIKDPSFQQQAMARVYTYFQRQHQSIRNSCPLPHNHSIMIQSFVDMISHLLLPFFGKHGIYKKNYIEEIPKLMKKLNYPGTLSSSWLKTVNAPHAWPHVVAILSWLVDLVSDHEELSIEDFFAATPGADSSNMVQTLIFKSILESYLAWNDQDDEKCKDIDLALCTALENNTGFTEEEVLKLTEEVESLSEQLNDPVEQHAIKEHEDLEKSVNKLCLKEDDLVATIKKLAASIGERDTELEKTQNHCTRLKQEIDSKTKQRQELNKILGSQKITVKEAQKMKEEINNTRQEIANNDEYLSSLQKIQCADDMKMASVKLKLNKMCVEFNKQILQSNMVELQELSVHTNLNFYERDLPAAVSEIDKITTSLQQLKAELSEKVKVTDSLFRKHDQVLKNLRHEWKKLNDKGKLLVEDVSFLEKELEMIEVEMEKAEADFNAEYAAIQTNIKKLISSMPNVEDINTELGKSHAEEAEARKKLEIMVQNCKEFLRRESEGFEEYKRKSYAEFVAFKESLQQDCSQHE